MEFLTNIKLSSDPVLTDVRITDQHYIVNHYRDENCMCDVLLSIVDTVRVKTGSTIRHNKKKQKQFENLQMSRVDTNVNELFENEIPFIKQ